MAYLTARQRAERAYVLRELLLRPALRRRENPSPDYTAAVDDLIEELVVTDNGGVMAVSVTDMLGRASDDKHNLIAAARVVMGHLEAAPQRASTRAHLGAGLAHRGFTPATVNAAITWLTEQHLITVTNGTITDVSGDRRPSSPRSPLPPELINPRNTAAPATSTPVNTRPNMGVDGRLIEHPERMDMGEKLRAQAESMPTASFEVGDTAKPAAKPTVEKGNTPVAIPDSAIVTYIDAITSAFARHGKPSATWKDLGVRLPSADLPEGITRQAVAAAALDKLATSRTIRHENGVYTHIPAERAVAALTEWIGESAKAGVLITPTAVTALARREDVRALTPNGWNAEGLVALALDAVVASGVMAKVDGGWMKPAPKVVATNPKTEVVEKPATAAPAPEPAPKMDTKSVTASKPDPSESGVPAPPAPAVNAGALERKVDTLTDAVVRVERKLDTLPPPPSAEKVLMADADTAVKALLESVCVRLKLDGSMTEGAIHRALPGKSKPSRVNPNPVDKRLRLGEALALGVDARILDFDHVTRKYRLITVANLMPKNELERRVKRIEDMRDAA